MFDRVEGSSSLVKLARGVAAAPATTGPSATLIADYQTAWVQANARSASDYISEALAQHEVVGIGERHHDGVTRSLVEDWISTHGTSKTALAVEVSSSDQVHLDALGMGLLPPNSKWWANQTEFKDMVTAAQAKGMDVLAVDADAGGMAAAEAHSQTHGSVATAAELHRDPQALANIRAAQADHDNVLVFYGAAHLQRGGTVRLVGPMLDEQIPLGYHATRAINTSLEFSAPGATPPVDPWRPQVDEFVELLRARFPNQTEFAFRLHGSPIEDAMTPVVSGRFADNFDGAIISIT